MVQLLSRFDYGFVMILLEKKSPHHSLGAPQDVEYHQAYLKLHVLFQSQQTSMYKLILLQFAMKGISQTPLSCGSLPTFQSFLPEETPSRIGSDLIGDIC